MTTTGSATRRASRTAPRRCRGALGPQRFGFSGELVARTLLEREPRIALFAARQRRSRHGRASRLRRTCWRAGEEKIVAERLHALLSSPPARARRHAAGPGRADLTGAVGRADRVRGRTSTHTLLPAPARATRSTARTGATSCRAMSPARSTATRCAFRSAYGEAAWRCAELHVLRHGDRRRRCRARSTWAST